MAAALLIFAYGSIDLCTYRTPIPSNTTYPEYSEVASELQNVFKREALFSSSQSTTHNTTVEKSVADWESQASSRLPDPLSVTDAEQDADTELLAAGTIDFGMETTTEMIVAPNEMIEPTTSVYESENYGLNGRDILYANLHDKNVYTFTFAMLITVSLPMLFTLIVSLLVVVTGTICYLRSYHPMDRSSTSNRMGVWTVRLAIFLLIAAPLLLLLADLSFAYAELHSQLCPTLQKNIQLKALEQKLDNFGGTIDDAEVTDALNDLRSHQRAMFNERECHHHSRGVHAIWISEMVLGIFGFMCSIVLLCLSKFFLRMKTEYYWNSSDNYSTLSDVRPDCTKIVTVSSAF